MIHLYTGDGKGKTTAAIGQAVRAAGRDLQVYFTQFMKGNDSGELHCLQKLPNVKILRSEKEFGFFCSLSDTDKQELTEIHNQILDDLIQVADTGKCDMIVMDEITYPVNWKLIDLKKLERLLELCECADTDGQPEIILTGRDAPAFFWERADYITEMACRRHPYERGIQARRGIEF